MTFGYSPGKDDQEYNTDVQKYRNLKCEHGLTLC